MFLFRHEDRWRLGIGMTSGHLVQATLIEADRDVADAQHDVVRELAMSYGMEVGSWRPSNRRGCWRANLWPSTQPG